MMGPYLEPKDFEEINERMNSVIKDTLNCWVATRINGASASMACDGNISIDLIKAFDRVRKELKDEGK